MTMSTAPTILVAAVFHESHARTPLRTTIANFVVTRGQALLEKALQSDASIGGAVRYLAGEGVNLIPSLAAISPPGGLLVAGLCDQFIAEIAAVAKAQPLDGIFLDLHGAIAGEDMVDFEARLCTRLRAELEAGIPIAVALDMHGIVCPNLVQAATILVSCKNNPHDDYKDAGQRAAQLMLQQLRGGQPLHLWAEWLPVRIPYPLETTSSPLCKIHAERRRLETGSIADISILNSYPFGIRAPGGQCILVSSTESLHHARGTAEAMAAVFRSHLSEFVNDLPSPAEALLQADTAPKPLIFGDFGDRVLAGSPGDSTYLARQILSLRPDLKVLAPITDPQAVAQAKALGPGGAARFTLGARWSHEAPALEEECQVLSLSDGRYTLEGPFMRGEPTSVGDCAVLRAGNLTVLATSMPALTQDIAAYRANDLQVADFDVIIVKSGSHYKLSLAKYGHCVNVSTPGFTNVG
ncbi:M81 family metallopeptidase [Mesorhizobium sp. L48C026A00]|uniref:M81 family metallopeptidase n=1 Tax=Mesorhizobium sp. L48C026A00 TaxID=1287182 RepID=UPI0003CFFD54|nr:M81 family metallopeptidase [Mesorhizobium sp. L48C026A00]ESZ02026.1 hypothetical protein X737_38675 [Mesorhizobium sp. L48C026A00]